MDQALRAFLFDQPADIADNLFQLRQVLIGRNHPDRVAHPAAEPVYGDNLYPPVAARVIAEGKIDSAPVRVDPASGNGGRAKRRAHRPLPEIAALRTAADQLTGHLGRLNIPRRLWWLSFIDFAYDTALRLSDILSVERGDIWPGGRLSIVQQKTGRAHTVQLRPRTVAEIDESMMAQPDRRLVWPLGCTRGRWYRQFRRLRESAGLPDGSAKWLRRASASYVERDHPGRGTGHLGHRNSELFRRFYCDRRVVGESPVLPPEI